MLKDLKNTGTILSVQETIGLIRRCRFAKEKLHYFLNTYCQVARLDYKPLVLDHDNNGDPYDSMIAVQSDIQDFEGTIAYQIDTVIIGSF